MVKDLCDKCMRFEDGRMSPSEMLEFFGELIREGLAWRLQGFYGRTASSLIQNGLLDSKGNITKLGRENLEESDEE
jgi:hypothetical protein